ncbi:hypothetical protein QJQ45_023125 [Haematococcus lacustris]|nr:hypothetical protein QJQ45_023125 [Haematococcus lacustris]
MPDCTASARSLGACSSSEQLSPQQCLKEGVVGHGSSSSNSGPANRSAWAGISCQSEGDIDQLNNYGSASTSRKFVCCRLRLLPAAAAAELAPNVPAAVLNDEYTVATLKLGSEIEEYCALDVYDKGRVPLIKSLKSDGTAWVSKYARGGSARTQSARRMYIAVDSVVGHLASNGYAPLPAPKVKAVLKSVGEARDFLAKGI